MLELSFHTFIGFSDTLEIHLEDEGHGIEKEWYIEDRIGHSDDLSCHCHRHEVTESYRRCRDHGKVEGIEVALSYRISLLEGVHEECSDEPTREKYDTDNDEFPMVDMKHRD